MNRTNFFNVVTVFETKELDFLWNSLPKFELKYDPIYYRIIAEDILRPDKISFKNYGTSDFWWVICLINDLNNPFADLIVGEILTIPNQLDIFDYQRKYRVRRSK